jgi:hypothetical protein
MHITTEGIVLFLCGTPEYYTTVPSGTKNPQFATRSEDYMLVRHPISKRTTSTGSCITRSTILVVCTVEIYHCSRNPAKTCQPPKCCDTGNFSRLLSRYFVLTCRGVIATITDKRTKKFAKNLSVHNCPLSLG